MIPLDRIALWLKSCEKDSCVKVGARWKKALEVSNKTNLKYQAHKDGEFLSFQLALLYSFWFYTWLDWLIQIVFSFSFYFQPPPVEVPSKINHSLKCNWTIWVPCRNYKQKIWIVFWKIDSFMPASQIWYCNPQCMVLHPRSFFCLMYDFSLGIFSQKRNHINNQILLSSLPSVILVYTFQATTMGLVGSRYLSLASRGGSR